MQWRPGRIELAEQPIRAEQAGLDLAELDLAQNLRSNLRRVRQGPGDNYPGENVAAVGVPLNPQRGLPAWHAIAADEHPGTRRQVSELLIPGLPGEAVGAAFTLHAANSSGTGSVR